MPCSAIGLKTNVSISIQINLHEVVYVVSGRLYIYWHFIITAAKELKLNLRFQFELKVALNFFVCSEPYERLWFNRHKNYFFSRPSSAASLCTVSLVSATAHLEDGQR